MIYLDGVTALSEIVNVSHDTELQFAISEPFCVLAYHISLPSLVSPVLGFMFVYISVLGL